MGPRTRRAQHNPAQSEPVLPGVQQVAGELAQAAVQQVRGQGARRRNIREVPPAEVDIGVC